MGREPETHVSRELRDILPEYFFDEAMARDILERIDFAHSRQRVWRSASDFWAATLRDLATAGKAGDLVRAVAEQYPGNSQIQDLLLKLEQDPQRSAASAMPRQSSAEESSPFHTLTLIGSDRPDDFLRLVRTLVDPQAELLYVSLGQSAVLIHDPGDRGGEIRQQLFDAVQGWGEGSGDVVLQTHPFRPYVYRHLAVFGPDNSFYELSNVPATTQVSDIATAVLQDYGDDAVKDQPDRYARTLDRIGENGTEQRLSAEATLHEAGVTDGAQLRVASETSVETVHPGSEPDYPVRPVIADPGAAGFSGNAKIGDEGAGITHGHAGEMAAAVPITTQLVSQSAAGTIPQSARGRPARWGTLIASTPLRDKEIEHSDGVLHRFDFGSDEFLLVDKMDGKPTLNWTTDMTSSDFAALVDQYMEDDPDGATVIIGIGDTIDEMGAAIGVKLARLGGASFDQACSFFRFDTEDLSLAYQVLPNSGGSGKTPVLGVSAGSLTLARILPLIVRTATEQVLAHTLSVREDALLARLSAVMAAQEEAGRALEKTPPSPSDEGVSQSGISTVPRRRGRRL